MMAPSPISSRSATGSNPRKRGSNLTEDEAEATALPNQKRPRFNGGSIGSANETHPNRGPSETMSERERSSEITASQVQELIGVIEAMSEVMNGDREANQRRFERIQEKLDAQEELIRAFRRQDSESSRQTPVPSTSGGNGQQSPSIENGQWSPSIKNDQIDLYNASPQPQRQPRPQNDRNSPVARQQQERADESANISNITEVSITLYSGMPMPAYVEEFPNPNFRDLPGHSHETFPWKFLRKMFGGHYVSNGFYGIPANNRKSQDRPFPDLTSWLAVTREFEPLLPRAPGEHGTQISNFMQARPQGARFPLFIQDHGGAGYRYFGTYKEPSESDRISRSEMIRMPQKVKLHHANELGVKGENGKPAKVIIALRDMWSNVSVGWWDPKTRQMVDYDEAKVTGDNWYDATERKITVEEAEEITSEEIMEAFDAADLDDAPSARLFYGYLQCVGYDHDFYEKLVAKKNELAIQEASST